MDKSRQEAYRGYLIRHDCRGETFIQRDGHCIGYAKSVEDAKRIIRELTDA